MVIDKKIASRMDYELLDAYRDNRYGGNKKNTRALKAELRRRELVDADGNLTSRANIELMQRLAG